MRVQLLIETLRHRDFTILVTLKKDDSIMSFSLGDHRIFEPITPNLDIRRNEKGIKPLNVFYSHFEFSSKFRCLSA